MKKDLLDFLKINEVEYKENVVAKFFSPVKIGGNVNIVIYPDNERKMISALDFLGENEICYKVIGRSSNILFPDTKVNTVLIKTDNMRGAEISRKIVRLSSGETLFSNARYFAKNGVGGISELCGIPGSIGGLIRNNAGAFGREIGDLVKSVKAYFPENKQILHLENKDLSFEYRSSIFKSNNLVVLSADLKMQHDSSPNDILREIEMYKDLRRNSQPTGLPSLGSVFKRPKGDFAARLIDISGLKGFSIGGAEVSRKHAGFIINKGNATSNDFRLLVEYIKQTVFELQGVKLEEEIEFL